MLFCVFGTLIPVTLPAQEQPWLKNPLVREVLAQRNRDIAALIEGRAANPDTYTSTFVAHTPDRGVVLREKMLDFLETGTVSYDDVEMTVEYAAAHGNDMVVIMGVEIVIPGEGLPNAGKRVHRRFTDIFRRENGEWRHDLRHANVVRIE